jgi:hypothetical protein
LEGELEVAGRLEIASHDANVCCDRFSYETS